MVPVAVLSISGTIFAKKKLDEAAQLVPTLPEKMRMFSSERSVIKSRDGKILESIATEFRKPVRIQDVPAKVIYATLAAEDKRFYEHSGVDYWAMGRAVFSTLSGRRTEGASTLTMQIAKRVYTSTSKTLDRKVQDMALATMIERKLAKEQILELYLNQVFYGSGAYGVSAAAEVYFGKTLQQLTWGEAATLARCVRRPSDENPYVNERVALRNRDIVLSVMHDEGWMTDNEYEAAKKEPMVLRKGKDDTNVDRAAPYFCDYVKSWLKENLPDIDLSKGGYTIETTLDTGMQKYAEKKVRDMVTKNRRLKITTAAFVLLDNEGRILAMVGGPDYKKNQFNVITQGHRQPGSSFKPIVYATAFEYGALSPNGYVSNEPYMIKDDHGRRRPIKGGGHGGDVSVRRAIAMSINTAAMWAMDKVGRENVINMAHSNFGIKSELPNVETLALGADEVTPLEMARAYSVFQNNGDRFEPFGVIRVIGSDGVQVKFVSPEFTRRQLGSTAAEGIDSCLRSVVTSGTATRAGSVTNARGKTGTTSSNKDAWFCGYTDKFLGIGWVANETRDSKGRVRYQPMDDYVMGGHSVAPLWADIVGHAQDVFGEDARKFRSSGSLGREEKEPADEENPGLDENKDPVPDDNPIVNPDVPEDAPDNVPTNEGNKPDKVTPIKPTEHDPRDPVPPAEKIVFVEICADSGQRATIYCPERVRKAFRAGTEPKGRCTLHKG